jgi:hypothetical protein
VEKAATASEEVASDLKKFKGISWRDGLTKKKSDEPQRSLSERASKSAWQTIHTAANTLSAFGAQQDCKKAKNGEVPMRPKIGRLSTPIEAVQPPEFFARQRSDLDGNCCDEKLFFNARAAQLQRENTGCARV